MSGFDEYYYLDQSDLVRARTRVQFRGSALLDYLWFGAREQRSPSAAFDEAYYLASNPDVESAIGKALFLCGYHHYLKNGEAEGRRGVQPARCCVIDAGLADRSNAPSVARLVSAIQRARPDWRLVVLARWKLPAGTPLHAWAQWIKAPGGSGDVSARAAAEEPTYVLCLGEPTIQPPSSAVVVAVSDRPEPPVGGQWDLADAIVRTRTDAAADDTRAAASAERIAVALETAEQVTRGGGRNRLIGGGPGSAVGLGLVISLPAGAAARLVTLAVDLPPASGSAKELIVLEAGGAPIELEVSVGRPARTAIRIDAAPARIVVRSRKSGSESRCRLVMARVESAPVDLVEAPDLTGPASDALAIVDLNTDLARAKRELGRFMTKAEALIVDRPAFEFCLPAVPRLAPISVPRCLVVSTFNAERSWIDRDTLDVSAWREYLESRGFAVDLMELPLETTSDAGRMRKQALTDHRFIVLTGPRSAELLIVGRDRDAQVRTVYRGAVSGGRVVAGHRRADDLACARSADKVVVAGAQDALYYRAGGVNPGRIDYVPEYLPSAFRRPARPYQSRPRQLVLHLDTLAVLNERIRRHGFVRNAVPALCGAGWKVVISASPRLRARIEADLDTSHELVRWCDPAVDLPQVLHSTRLMLVPALGRAEMGGLTTVARILGFRILSDEPVRPSEGGGFAAFPRTGADVAVLDHLDRDPGSLDMEAVRADAYRSLNRVFGFRDAGWQEGRGDRSPDI